MISIAVSGAFGRMGTLVRKLGVDSSEFKIEYLIDRRQNTVNRKQMKELPCQESCVESLTKKVDCLIDFSSPEGSMQRIKECVKLGVPMVIGTTGFSEQQERVIIKASKIIPILKESNMSIGVNLVYKMLDTVKGSLNDFDLAITETHHVAKKDKPSGTAISMSKQLGRDIQINSLRLGDVVGEHTIVFRGKGEQIELTHRSYTREIFAIGALKAAKFIVNKQPGLYRMFQVT